MKRSVIIPLTILLLLSLHLNKVIGEDDGDYEYEDGLDEEEYEEEEGGEDEVDEKDVVVITSKNWSEVVDKAKFALVEFYAPWCGHCKALKPQYARAASSLKAYDESIVVGKVDATVETVISDKYKIEGYPTIKWLVEGEAMEYSGARDEESIVRWVKKKTGPPAVTIENLEHLKKLEQENEVLTVGYFKSFDTPDFKSFISAAHKTDDSSFAQTINIEIAKKVNLEKFGVSLVRNSKGENRTVVPLTAELSMESIVELIRAEKLPMVIHFTDEGASKMFNSGIDFHMIFIGGQEMLQIYNDIIQSVAKKFRGKVIIVLADTDTASADPIMSHFELEKSDKIQVVGLLLEKGKKFFMDIGDELTEETAKAFAQGMVDGSLKGKIKSGPIPESEVDGNVAVVVGDTVDTIVKDETKDVLLEIYAPWCGHCQQLAPIYQKLAKRFSSVDSVIIAKMDGVDNEHPDVEFDGFPTIKFFPACDLNSEDCELIDFDGERTLLGFTKFIKQHARTEYILPKKSDAEKAKKAEEPERVETPEQQTKEPEKSQEEIKEPEKVEKTEEETKDKEKEKAEKHEEL